jgi:hypothetical protein
MRAFRTQRRFGGWLALFALGLQLTLSFGHIHAEDFARAGVAATAQSQAAPDGDHNSGGQDRDHDGCAICAVMHLAATSLVPAPPSLSLPPAATFVTLITLDATALPPSARQPFQARAPPQA